MAKAVFRPQRTEKKPGPKNVKVEAFKRSSPKPINKKCR